jgi:hypothetical protein
LAALAGKRQEFNDATVRTANLSSSEDNPGEVLIIQHSVSSNLLRRQWYPFGWRLIEDSAPNAPAQERLDRLQGLVGGDWCPTLLNGGDHLNHVSLRDLMNAPSGPRPAHLATEELGNLAPRTVL